MACRMNTISGYPQTALLAFPLNLSSTRQTNMSVFSSNRWVSLIFHVLPPGFLLCLDPGTLKPPRKNVKNMKKQLYICIEIEETVGKIYRHMTTSPHLTAEIRTALQELAEDEDDHANQLRFALRFPEGSVVKNPSKTLEEAGKILAKAKDAFDRIQNIEVDDRQALNIGIELEKHFQQVHIANSFEFQEENYRKMFAAMAKEDERHCKQLEELHQKLCQ